MRSRKVILSILGVALLAAAGLTVLFMLPRSPLPQAIRSEIEFSPLIPVSKSIESKSYKLANGDSETQTLSYVIVVEDTSVTVSQYPQPQQFNDVPEYKERFLSNVVQQYASVQTASGVIYLGRASKSNQQIGVMIERGLLVFFNPSEELNESQWRRIGDSLEIVK